MNTTYKFGRPYKSLTTDTLLARRQELLDMMPDPAHVIRASLITRSIKCGKPNCRCATGEGHKSLYLSSYYNGKTQLDSVPKSYQDKVSQCIKDYEESTQRQYALRERALSLGWPEEHIRIIDGDLGISGSGRSRRPGFAQLVTSVSLGEVGAVFGLEISRLARSSADLMKLLELCSLFGTLVIDEDGIYDMSDFNDRLLIGLKGTMGEAELHFLHARMIGGKENAASRGELRFPLPVGYIYDPDGRLRLAYPFREHIRFTLFRRLNNYDMFRFRL